MTTTEELIEFIEKSPTPYHAVRNAEEILKSAGFERLDEKKKFSLKRGGSYYITRNSSALIAFRIPLSATAFSIIAAHTDSPVIRLKKEAEVNSAGYITLDGEIYGGMLQKPWFDRPLSIAGRVFVRTKDSIEERLFDAERPLVLIPSLAIHMDRRINEDGIKSVQKEMMALFAEGNEKGKLKELIASALSVKADEIIDSDLIIYNWEKGTIWGADNEFFSAPRIDDLGCVYPSIKAIRDTKGENYIPLVALFDNEEIGSGTRQGALSDFLRATMNRIGLALGLDEEERMIAASSSFMLSADNGHAVHPNYREKADPLSQPVLNGGVLLKYSGNMKYSTDGKSGSYIRKIMEDNNIPYQIFSNHSDIPGGSTLGNLSSEKISIETADVGIAQLAMHSPYESAGVRDSDALLSLFKRFLSR